MGQEKEPTPIEDRDGLINIVQRRGVPDLRIIDTQESGIPENPPSEKPRARSIDTKRALALGAVAAIAATTYILRDRFGRSHQDRD